MSAAQPNLQTPSTAESTASAGEIAQLAASEIKTVGVIGGGQMGQGIAQVAAQTGRHVILVDLSEQHAVKAIAKIAKGVDRLVEKGKTSAADRDTLLSLVRPGKTADLSAADLVIEAATEQFDLKVEIFRNADAAMRPEAILATNTSSISITKLAAATSRPERVAGMHFMNPVPIMKLCEIVRGLQTSDATLKTVTDLAHLFGKTTILSNDAPGFLVNRILIPLINEACFALNEGVGSAADLDLGAKLGLNHPMGPLELADLIGLDTCLAIAEVLHRELGDDKYRPCVNLRNLVAAGWLGRKSGRGFYRYDDRGQKVV